MTKGYALWAGLATVVVLAAGAVILFRPPAKEPIQVFIPAEAGEPPEITVHVAGAVQSPGLYTLGGATGCNQLWKRPADRPRAPTWNI